MDPLQVEMFTGQQNYAVLRLPDRKFPGVVFQGDSLSMFLDRLRSLNDDLSRAASPEGVASCAEELSSIVRDLGSVQRAYEAVLHDNDIPLPYIKRYDYYGP